MDLFVSLGFVEESSVCWCCGDLVEDPSLFQGFFLFGIKVMSWAGISGSDDLWWEAKDQDLVECQGFFTGLVNRTRTCFNRPCFLSRRFLLGRTRTGNWVWSVSRPRGKACLTWVPQTDTTPSGGAATSWGCSLHRLWPRSMMAPSLKLNSEKLVRKLNVYLLP